MSTNKIPKTLPTDPMLSWIKERVEKETTEVFSQRVGVSDRRIREVVNGRVAKMSFKNIDRIITNDGTVNFIDFYPEYDTDEFFLINESNKYNQTVLAVPKRICSMDGCEDGVHAKNLCHRHYRQHRRNSVAA